MELNINRQKQESMSKMRTADFISEYGKGYGNKPSVLTDVETGVQYLVFIDYEAGISAIPRLNADGTVRVVNSAELLAKYKEVLTAE